MPDTLRAFENRKALNHLIAPSYSHNNPEIDKNGNLFACWFMHCPDFKSGPMTRSGWSGRGMPSGRTQAHYGRSNELHQIRKMAECRRIVVYVSATLGASMPILGG